MSIGRAYYKASLNEFLETSPEHIAGVIQAQHVQDIVHQQSSAWRSQIHLLQQQLTFINGGQIFFEFVIPRMGKRADIVLLTGGVVFIIEFKVGESLFHQHDIRQVHDYALDLKNFHAGSHLIPIVPVLVATHAPAQEILLRDAWDGVIEPILSSGKNLGALIEHVVAELATTNEIPGTWEFASYKPTPTIVQAAQALYANHAVEDIARSDSGAVNLARTSKILQDIVQQSHRNRRKSICFVTGVPGAGKTLVGLDIATMTTDTLPAVFLSGNGPLVEVLREALARDQHSRGMATSKEAAKRSVNTFIQNIHHFRNEALRTIEPPHERVAVFDEAQRAWDAKHTAKFMVGKRNQLEWQLSEPEFLIQIMDRHADWCVVIALVGSGQEINSGEAGLRGWVEAIEARNTGWDVYFSQQLRDVEYEQVATLFDQLPNSIVESVPDLHLATSMRSFRAERLSQFIHLLLQGDAVAAREILEGIGSQYPIFVTQNIELAKEWVNRQVRGSERSGVLASSGGIRLKPHAINVKSKVDAAVWFLNEPSDIRSSTFLEDAATEFDVQGLELDWGLVAWDGDLRHNGKSFEYWDFRGTAWQHTSRWQFLQNAYRVLLTRFRQGFVIFVPEGDVMDPTRDPLFYDKTFEYLRRCGIPELSSSEP